MGPLGRLVFLLCVAALGGCAFGLQRPPPRYSQQYMPETSFTCRNKIVGSYYADPETDCQVFHVCVSVSGTIQDYKFLCPNDTAFDQESQTCADWYDVDCEAATLYYASDNFDLYRLGSGLESPHYDSIRSDAEPQDHLQRSETSDPVRSSANTLNRVSSSGFNGNRDLRGSSSGNFYNNRNGKEEDYESEKSYKDEIAQDGKKKTGIRKVSRKQQFNDNGNGNYAPSSTAAPAVAAASAASQNSYTGFYSGNNYNQRANGFVSSTSARPQENFNRNQNTQRYNAQSSTYRPSTNYQNNYSFQSPSTTSRTTVYNAYNTNPNYNQQSAGGFSQSTTLKPTSYNKNYNQNYNQNYNNGGPQFVQSTTLQPSTNYQANDYSNYQRSYNNIQRTNGNTPYQSTTAGPTIYDNNYNNNNNNNNHNNNNNNNSNNNNNNNNNSNGQYRAGTTTRQDNSQATTKYFSNFASSSYAPTTYSPATKKYIANDNTQAQTAIRNTQENTQYYEKSSQPIKSSSQYYDSTKAPKKATQYNNYDGSNGKYYTETSTGNYDLARSSVGIGFSPASINHLAETPRSTTPVPRRISTATTYNPNSFNSNTQRPPQSPTTPRGSTYVSGSARPFSSTTRLPSSTSPRPKSGKKSDYDYAYYDNTAGLEYDSLDLEHVTGNKESTKIARN